MKHKSNVTCYPCRGTGWLTKLCRKRQLRCEKCWGTGSVELFIDVPDPTLTGLNKMAADMVQESSI